MALRLTALLVFQFLVQAVVANVEKTIFLAPEPVTVPKQHPTLEDLRLDVLTPDTWSRRTYLPAKFPTESDAHGSESWFLLDDLAPGQRYEVRVCWPATQPTSFWLDAFELQTVWDTPELITSLSAYSYARQPSDETSHPPSSTGSKDATNSGERTASALFLRVQAAADYFTTNATLMRDVPPVHADLILDPYLLNVLPRSLAPTVLVILTVAVAAWLVASRLVLPWLDGVIATGQSQKRKTQ